MIASPALFFGPDDLPRYRERVARPELEPVWRKIVERAEQYCDPQHRDYVDPENPFQEKAKGEHVPDSRHAAILVHSVGRKLSDVMETVGIAYQLTGREEFGRHGAAYLHAIATEFPSDRPEVAKGFAGGRGDVMRGLALGYDWLHEAMTEAQRREVAEVAKGYILQFREEFEDPKTWWYKVHNYNGVNGGAAGCLALALHDAYPDEYEVWADHAVAIIERWMDTGFDEDGAYSEGVSYSSYGLTNALLFATALRRTGNKHDLYRHPLFGQLRAYYALSLLPGDRVYDARNDSGYQGLGAMLLGLAGELDDGLYRWLWDQSGSDSSFLRIIWDNDVAPVDPQTAGIPLALHFRGRGLCVWRTGWTAEDVMFSVESGAYYAITHNQADKGHFTLYGLGQRWAVDTGYCNDRAPRARGQSYSHSLVHIDGKGQALSGAGLGTNGTIVAFSDSNRYGYALADCTEAYNQNNRGMKGAGVEFARRHTLFVRPKNGMPAYAVVLDDIRKDGEEHDYSWQMMIDKSIDLETDGSTAILGIASASGGAYVDTPWTSGEDAVASVVPGNQPPGEAVFELDVPEAGTYTLWARVRTQVPERSKGDSFFVRMDDGKQFDWHMPSSGTWVWGKVAAGVAPQKPVVFDLAAGKHRLVFRRREPGAELDCLVLTADAEQAPSLLEVRNHLLFREAESAQLSAPMRLIRVPAEPTRMIVRLDAVAPIALAPAVSRVEDYHGPGVFPMVRGEVRAVNPRFAAVLLPLPGEIKTPEVSFAPVTGGREIRIAWPSHEDILFWPDQADQAPVLR
jgi:hypothetical protein